MESTGLQKSWSLEARVLTGTARGKFWYSRLVFDGRPLLATYLLILFSTALLHAQAPTHMPPPAPPAVPQTPALLRQDGLRVVVLDAGHGGTDAGARGPAGVLEKDVVLVLARLVRNELERQGYQVVLTREGNDNPSFEDRAALANAQRGFLFITLHISSTGPTGTARAYYYGGAKADPASSPASAGLTRWEEAQLPHIALSRRFAELLQVQLGLKFRGSAEIPSAAAVRQLRSVAGPAVAVEISSVAASSRSLLDMGPGLAAAILRAAEAFRPLYEAGVR
jgi:N-acetylmuramoyl-L-alanine amidase